MIDNQLSLATLLNTLIQTHGLRVISAGMIARASRHNRWTCPDFLRSLLELTPVTVAPRNQVGHVAYFVA
jgi:hypothetical protein